MAHKQYLQVKNLVSIGNIVSNFKDSQAILTNPRYKQVESLINSEEFPIVMFLTTMRTEIENQDVQKNNPIIDAEIQDLFNVSTSMDQLQYLFGCHVSALVSRRSNSTDPKELLKHCYQVSKSLDIEQFFKQFIKKRGKLENNDVFRNLERQDEATLV